MVAHARRYLFAVLAGCGGGGGGGSVDAPVVIVDAPPDAKQWLDAPPLMFDFSCATNPAPTTAAANITVSGIVRRVEFNGTLMINPLDGASIRVCAAPGAPNCSTSGNQYGSTVTTANGGMHSVTFASGGQPVDAYIEMTESTSRTAFAYPAQPYTVAAHMTADVLTFTPQLISSLALVPNGCTQSASNGMIALGLFDCANQPIADTVMLSIKQSGNEVQGTTVIDLGAVNAGAAGLFLICNVPPNPATTVGASWNGMQLRAHDLKIVQGTTSQTVLRPGFTM